MARHKRQTTAVLPQDDPMERIANWVEILARTLAVATIEDAPERFKTVATKIDFLTRLGYTAKDIAAIAGTSTQVVANAQSAARKRKTKRAE